MNNCQKYYDSNYFFRYIGGQGWKNILKFISVITAFLLIGYFVCLYEGSLIIIGEHAGFLEDIVSFTLSFMFVIKLLLTTYLLKKLELLFKTLPDIIAPLNTNSSNSSNNNEILLDIKNIKEYILLETESSRKHYFILLSCMSILVLIFQIIIPIFFSQPIKSWAIWPQKYPFSYIYAIIWAIFCWIIVIGNIYWYVWSIGYKVFINLYKYAKENRLVVIPIAPDGKGGISPIGDLSFALTTVVSSGMLLAIAWIVLFGVDLPFTIGFWSYCVLLVIIFFLPLLSIHRAMKKAKNQEIYRLSILFHNEYSKLKNNNFDSMDCRITSTDKSTTMESVKYLSYIDQLYRRVESMPIWPFNFATLGRFISLFIIPIVLFIIQSLTDNILLKLIKNLF